MSQSPPDEPDEPAGAHGRAEAGAAPARPELQPVEVDARPVVAIGTIGWLVALLLLGTVFHGTLTRHHAGWWLWSCVAGAAFGVYGLYYVRRR